MTATPVHASISIATPESDARLAAEIRAAGAAARRADRSRESCPHDPRSLIASWWFEGYDRGPGGAVASSKV